MEDKPTYAGDATSLGEANAALEAQGFTGQFVASEGEAVICLACHTHHHAGSVHLRALYRVEGAPDPADMAAVAAVICPACGAKGTLVLRYGAEATPEEADVLRLL